MECNIFKFNNEYWIKLFYDTTINNNDTTIHNYDTPKHNYDTTQVTI